MPQDKPDRNGLKGRTQPRVGHWCRSKHLQLVEHHSQHSSVPHALTSVHMLGEGEWICPVTTATQSCCIVADEVQTEKFEKQGEATDVPYSILAIREALKHYSIL